MNKIKEFFARLFYNPNAAADKNFRFLIEQDNKMLWLRERGYKIRVPLNVFADIYALIKGMQAEDIRKFDLGKHFGFDIYAVKVCSSFIDTVKANSNWLGFTDSIDKWEKGPVTALYFHHYWKELAE